MRIEMRKRNAYRSKLNSWFRFFFLDFSWKCSNIDHFKMMALITVIWVSKVTSMQINQLLCSVIPLIFIRMWWWWNMAKSCYVQMWNDLCCKKKKTIASGKHFSNGFIMRDIKNWSNSSKNVRIVVDKLILIIRKTCEKENQPKHISPFETNAVNSWSIMSFPMWYTWLIYTLFQFKISTSQQNKK